MFIGDQKALKCAFETAPHVYEGEMKTGAQEHFYMETQATLAIPHENQEMELFGRYSLIINVIMSI